MKKLTVTIGERFNKLTVINMPEIDKGFTVAHCRCDCGVEVKVRVAELRSGHKKSCGCASWKARGEERDKEIVGKRFGRLTVLNLAGKTSRNYRQCECQCDCGKVVKLPTARMVAGDYQSCGCLQVEKAMQNLAVAQRASIKHGMSDTLTGRSWMCMMSRCFNEKHENYKYYGAKGITPCEFLKSSPVNLVVLIGERPFAAMTLGRIKNELGYWCGTCQQCLTNKWGKNVQWETVSEQALKRSNTRLVELDGVIKVASEWCKLLGLSRSSKQIYTYPKKKDE